MDKHRRLPISFSLEEEVNGKDNRFLKIAIDVLHCGLNFNGSVFEEDVVNSALPSIKNTPILGYVLVDDEGGTDDFASHEWRFVDTPDGMKYMYAGAAYGVIPEDCNPRWITKLCSDGKLRKFLRVDGLMWTKFDRAIEIFERDIVKAQSMELADDYKGIENPDGTFKFTDFKFDGCCILSTTDAHIQPAMINSTATAEFSLQDFTAIVSKDVRQHLEEYHAAISGQPTLSEVENIQSNKGGTNNLNYKDKILNKYHIAAEALNFSIDDDMSEAEFEAKVKACAEAPAEEHPAPNFALESQFVDALMESLRSETVHSDLFGDYPKYCFIDYDRESSEVFCFDCEDGKLYGFVFAESGDVVSIDFACKKRKKFAIVDFEGEEDAAFVAFSAAVEENVKRSLEGAFASKEAELQTKVETANSAYEDIKTKYEDVSAQYAAITADIEQQKAEAEDLAKDEVFEKFEKELSDVEDFSTLKDAKTGFTADQIAEKCYALLGKKKATFSVKPSSVKTPKLPVVEVAEVVSDVPYAHLFK